MLNDIKKFTLIIMSKSQRAFIIALILALTLTDPSWADLHNQGSVSLPSSYFMEYEMPEGGIVYRSNFEDPDALEQPGWRIDQGEASIVDEGYEGSCVRVEPSPEGKFGQVTLTLDPPPDLPVVFVDMQVKPVAFAEGPEEFADVAGSVTGAFRLVKESEAEEATAALYVLNGSGERGGDWLDTGVTFRLDEEGRPLDWMRLTFRQEFFRTDTIGSQDRWDLWVDGRLVSADLGYYDHANIDPGRVTLLGHRLTPLYMDSLTVSSSNPLFVDKDADGLADAFEQIYNLVGGRDGDLDDDGLLNFHEYMLGTNPTLADTDGDGLNDQEEVGDDTRDPLDNSDRTLIGASGGFDVGVLSLSYTDCDDAWLGIAGTAILTFSYSSHEVEVVSATATGYDGDAFSLLIDNSSDDGKIIMIGLSEPEFDAGMITVNLRYRFIGGSTWTYTTEVFEWWCDCSCGCFDVYTATSVHVTIGLGQTDFGDRTGELKINERKWSDRLYSRASVIYTGPKGPGLIEQSPVEINGREYLAYDWIKTATKYVRFTDLENGYLIDIFPLDQVDRKNDPRGEPMKRIRVTNPDPTNQSGIRRVQFVQDIGRSAAREFRFFSRGGNEVWEKYEGSISSFLTEPMRYERVTYDRSIPTTRKGRPQLIMRKEVGHWDTRQNRYVADSVVESTEERFAFGNRLVKKVVDPDGEALETRYGYDSNAPSLSPNETGLEHVGSRLVQWVSYPDGNWEWYRYDDQARRVGTARPVGNQVRPDAFPQAGPGYEVETFDFDGPGYRVRSTLTRNGHFVRREFRDWNDGDSERLVDVAHRVAVSYDPEATASDPRNEIRRTVRGRDHGKIIRSEQPDGSYTTHSYRVDGDLREHVTKRFDREGRLGVQIEERVHRSGTVLERKRVDGPSGLVVEHWRVEAVDSLHRPLITMDEVRGEVSSKGYDCCDEAWRTSGDGLATVTVRDVLGRVVGERQGIKDVYDTGNQLESQLSGQTYFLDGLDRRVTTTTLRADSGKPLTSHVQYNLAGQQTANVDMTNVLTQYKTIILPEGGRMELTSLPKSGRDQRYRIDSRTYNAEGELVRERSYAADAALGTDPARGTQTSHRLFRKGRDAQGRYAEVTDIANLFDRRVTRTYLDERGRKKEVIRAFGTGLAARENFDYNEDGKLIRHIDPDGATTRYAYDGKGQRIVTALDMNVEPNEAVDHIDYGVDRINRVTTTMATTKRGQVILRTSKEVFTESGPVVVSVQEQSLDGSYSATVEGGQRATRQRADGEEPGQWSVVVTKPDGSHSVQRYENGRLVRNTRHASDGTVVSWTSRAYDGFGRLSMTTDSRIGTTSYHYDGNGRKWKVSAPNPETGESTGGTLDTLYYYDSLGQLVRTIKPSGGVIHRVYNANGTLYGIQGHHIIDVTFGYNGRGERTRLSTQYGADKKSARTRWIYDTRGQLAIKEDALGRRVHYTFTPGGRPKTRTWARGVKTTYEYDRDNGTDLRNIDYSDDTPDISFTYTRIGQKKIVTDAGGITTYTYHSKAPTQVLSVTAGTDLYAEPKTITYLRDDLHRIAGFQVGNASNPDGDYSIAYQYDTVGRLESVHGHGYWFDYAYEPNSTTDRLKTLTAPFVKQTEFTYERGRDTIASVSNRVGFNLDKVVSQYDYAIDADGKRVARITNIGDDENSYKDRFSYDVDTGGLTALQRNNENFSSTYAYDKIGNRKSAAINESETVYESNALNQYTAIGDDARFYDPDGNLIVNGDQSYTWDAENRLVAIRERGGSVRAQYTYDHQSRRVARKTQDGVDERYLFQSWNLICVYGSSEISPSETYFWGKDLGGSFQGAGGVGGLLFAKKGDHGSDAWIYHYDANGNVTTISNSKGKILESLEFDPFGNLLGRPRLPENRWRFSTKPQDDETDFYYYGYRYYDASNGKWLSRDPISERGGMNLYSILRNDCINETDYLGLICDNIKIYQEDFSPPNYGHRWIEFQSPGEPVDAWGYWPVGHPVYSEGRLFEGNDPKGGDADAQDRVWGIKCKRVRNAKQNVLKYGSGAGKRCCDATCDEIEDCLKKALKEYAANHGYSIFCSNCRTALEFAKAECKVSSK